MRPVFIISLQILFPDARPRRADSKHVHLSGTGTRMRPWNPQSRAGHTPSHRPARRGIWQRCAAESGEGCRSCGDCHQPFDFQRFVSDRYAGGVRLPGFASPRRGLTISPRLSLWL